MKKINGPNHFGVIFVLTTIVCFSLLFLTLSAFAEQSGSTPESGTDSRMKEAYDSLVTLGHGSDSASTWGDWSAYWNRIRSSAEWLPNSTATVNDVFPGKTFYSENTRTIKTGSALIGKYTEQANMAYDDWVSTSDTADEYTGEEQTWVLTAEGGVDASVTDNGVTRSLYTNEVNQDTLTKLYWTDRSSDPLDNEFEWVAGDDRVNPTGTSCNFNSAGTANEYCDNRDPRGDYGEDDDVSAAEFCLNLELDADNADGDNNGLTGVETDWRLPSQKEIMQAYINGSANNLPHADTASWSSTETSLTRSYACFSHFHDGSTSRGSKSVNTYVRCVRDGQ